MRPDIQSADEEVPFGGSSDGADDAADGEGDAAGGADAGTAQDAGGGEVGDGGDAVLVEDFPAPDAIDLATDVPAGEIDSPTGPDLPVEGEDVAPDVAADLTDTAAVEDALDGSADPELGIVDAPDSADLQADSAADADGELPPIDPCAYFEEGLVGQPTDPANPHFVDVSEVLGLPALTGIDPVFGGVALLDIDSAYGVDIVYVGQGGNLQVLMNCGTGTFREESGRAGLNGVVRARSLTHADVDNDGDADLYVGGYARSYLFRNDGGTFKNVSEEWGMGQLPTRGGAAFGDFDGDGWLDLYETGYETRRNRLRRSRGDHFETVTNTPNADPAGTSLAAAWVDMNEDDRPDLYIVNDFGMIYARNQLYLNIGPDVDDPQNWLFVEVGAQTGFGVRVFGMGVAFGDVDNDLDEDCYIGSICDNPMLYVERGEGCDNAFGFCAVDRAREVGVPSGVVERPGMPADWQEFDPDSSDPMAAAMAVFIPQYCETGENSWAVTSWSPVFFDANQDGFLDLFISNGHVPFSYMPMSTYTPSYLYLNDGDGTFTEAPAGYLPNAGVTARGAAAGDIDRDGDMDLVWLDNGRISPGRLQIRENRASLGAWLKLTLVGTISNRDSIGARVTIEAAGQQQMRVVDGGEGYASAGERVVHFGLGELDQVDRVTVRWPSGRELNLLDVGVDQHLTLTEPGL